CRNKERFVRPDQLHDRRDDRRHGECPRNPHCAAAHIFRHSQGAERKLPRTAIVKQVREGEIDLRENREEQPPKNRHCKRNEKAGSIHECWSLIVSRVGKTARTCTLILTFSQWEKELLYMPQRASAPDIVLPCSPISLPL